MNICICMKQVPDTTEIKINPETNTLIRDGVESIVNPFDAYALEAAARIKDNDPETKIVVITMGPQQAKAALKECLAIAADKAYLITDRKFGGSDTLATSYILKNAIAKIEETEGKFDAIFCGKQAIDGDTAQTGPELAEHMDYPQVTYALEVVKNDDTSMQILKEGQDYNMVIEVQKPCVVTFTKPSFDPRYANLRRKIAANKAVIPEVTSEDLTDIDYAHAGLKGSPTRVKKTFVPVRDKNTTMIKEETAQESAAKLAQLLTDANII